jgi:hypothetical protein
MHGRDEIYKNVGHRILKDKIHLGYLSVNGRVILKCILE